MDIQKEAEFFDHFESNHGDYDVLAEDAYRRLLGLFDALVRPRRGERCIDLGCGTGAFTRRLRGFGLDLVGLDISPKCVERANRQSAGERYVVGDMVDTKLDDKSFDIVLYSGVLHHIDNDPARVRVLREACRILRPGGRLFAYDPSAQSPSMWLYRDPRSPLYSQKGKTDNEVLLHRVQLADQLREAGFSSLNIRGVGGITYRYVDSPHARVLLPLYNTYERLLRWSPVENRFGTFLVTYAERSRN